MAKCSDCGSEIPDAAHACPSCGWIRDRRDADGRAGDNESAARFGAAMRGLHDGPRKHRGSNAWVAVAVALVFLLAAAVVFWLSRR